MLRKNNFISLKLGAFTHLHKLLSTIVTLGLMFLWVAGASGAPALDKTTYHTWQEVDAYLQAVADDPQFSDIVALIPIGNSREGKPLRVLRISKEGISGKDPDSKPAAFIMGAHHAREHVSKEAVLALINKIINGYGQPGAEGQTITYLVDADLLSPAVGESGRRHERIFAQSGTAQDELRGG
jgi:hypothetical protein